MHNVHFVKVYYSMRKMHVLRENAITSMKCTCMYMHFVCVSHVHALTTRACNGNCKRAFHASALHVRAFHVMRVCKGNCKHMFMYMKCTFTISIACACCKYISCACLIHTQCISYLGGRGGEELSHRNL